MLASVLLVGALAASACGEAETSAGVDSDRSPDAAECPVEAIEEAEGITEVTVWHPWVGLSKITLEKIADDYNASQDRVRVNVENQGNNDELMAKYESRFGDQTSLPDIVVPSETTTRFMVDSGTVMPAQACIDADAESADFYDQVLPAVISGFTVEDQLWPAAFGVAQPVLYINANHFREAGLSIESEDLPGTLEELRDAAEAIAAAGIEGVERPLVGRMESWFFEDQLTGAKRPIVDKDNGRSGLATESMLLNDTSVEILEWYRDMHDDGLFNAVPYSNPYDSVFAMALGNSSMLIDTSSAITSVNGAIEGTLTNEQLGAEDLDIDLSTIRLEGLDVGVGLNPGVEAAGQGKLGGSGFYLVDRGDDVALSAAWDFIRYFNSPPVQVRWTLEGSFLPVSEAAREDQAVQEEFTSTRRGRWLAIAAGTLEELDPEFPGAVIGPYNQFQAGVRDMLEKVILGDEDISVALERLDADLQRELDLYANDVTG
jgi:sn-glycerol 3-phosphate transport system substrate-binding protein